MLSVGSLLMGMMHTRQYSPSRSVVPEGYEDAGGDRARAPEPTAAVDHNVLPSLEAIAYVMDQGLILLRLGLSGDVHVLYAEAEYFDTLYQVLLEELRDPVAVVLVLLHHGDEHVRAVFLPKHAQVRLEIPIPPPVLSWCLHPRSEGHSEPPRNLRVLLGHEVHPDRVRLGGHHIFAAHLFSLPKVSRTIIHAVLGTGVDTFG